MHLSILDLRSKLPHSLKLWPVLSHSKSPKNFVSTWRNQKLLLDCFNRILEELLLISKKGRFILYGNLCLDSCCPVEMMPVLPSLSGEEENSSNINPAIKTDWALHATKFVQIYRTISQKETHIIDSYHRWMQKQCS